MASKLFFRFLLMSVLLLWLAACSDGDDRNVEGEINQRIAARTADLTRKLWDNCYEGILNVATVRAESLLRDRARRLKQIDGRPPKPRRPGAPPPQELSKPLPLRPLFPFEIRFDTLLRDSLRQDSILRDSLLHLDPDL